MISAMNTSGKDRIDLSHHWRPTVEVEVSDDPES